MRKVTQDVVNAFLCGSARSIGSTSTNGKEIYLHGNCIARRNPNTGKLEIRTCGWETNVTKERLNALPGVDIVQRKRVWYLNGKEWRNNEDWTAVQ